MNERKARRAELLARAHDDRRRIAQELVPVAGALGYVERGWAAVQWVRQRPLLVAAAVAAGTALSFIGRRRRRGPLNLLKLGFSAWQSWRWVARALASSRNPSRQKRLFPTTRQKHQP